MRDWRSELRARLDAPTSDPASAAEVIEELAQHLEDQSREMRARGLSDADVDRALLEQLSDPNFSSGVMRRRRARTAPPAPIGGPADARGVVASIWQDIRYGWRSLRRSPAFASVAVLSLGLGIGANTAIFGLLNAVLLERLHVSRPEQLVTLQWTAGTKKMIDHLTFTEYRGLRDAPGLPPLAANVSSSVTVLAKNARDYTNADAVTGGYFELVGVRPLLGRTISANDDATGAPVVVVSEQFWRDRFDGDPAALGQTIAINDKPFTIVGVLPRAFHGVYFGGSFAMAIPLGAGPLIGVNAARNPDRILVSVVARLSDGMTREAASGAFDRAVAAIKMGRDRPTLGAVDMSRGIASMKIDLRGQYRRLLIVLMAGVAIVLLIACANVGNLMLARAAARQRELAVRMSMGATRSRIIRQLFTEALELAIAGGVLGLLLARLGTSLLSHNLPPVATNLSEQIVLRPSPVILAFAGAVTLGCTLLFGVFPAVRATRADIMTPLKDGAKGSGGRSRLSLDRGLVVAQVALALVLVCAAALFVSTLRNLREYDGGYRTTRVLMAYVDARGTPYETRGVNPIYPELLERAARLPGVQRVAAAMTLPVFLGRRSRDRIGIPGYEPVGDEDMSSWMNAVSPGFFSTTGIGLRAGREFDARDRDGSEPVAIVSLAFAKHYFGARDPIGASIVVPSEPPIRMRIIGVANDARYEDLRAPATELFYIPIAQDGNEPIVSLVIRTDDDPNAIAPALMRQIDAAAPGIRVRRLVALEQALNETLARERLTAALATMFGAIALALAAIGLYGVVAYHVARRTPEIGIRMALGATPRDALWLVVRQALVMTLLGVAIGVPLALAAGRAIATQLYGVGANDPVTMIRAAVLLAAAGLTASVVPGRRAASIDPVEALRAE